MLSGVAGAAGVFSAAAAPRGQAYPAMPATVSPPAPMTVSPLPASICRRVRPFGRRAAILYLRTNWLLCQLMFAF